MSRKALNHVCRDTYARVCNSLHAAVPSYASTAADERYTLARKAPNTSAGAVNFGARWNLQRRDMP